MTSVSSENKPIHVRVVRSGRQILQNLSGGVIGQTSETYEEYLAMGEVAMGPTVGFLWLFAIEWNRYVPWVDSKRRVAGQHPEEGSCKRRSRKKARHKWM